MNLIGIDKLKAFWKYYDDFELLYDSRYVNKKKILKEISEEEIRILSILEYHYFLINANTDSKKLVERYKKVIEENKHKVTPEVLNYLERGVKPEIVDTRVSWLKKILKI